jgi:alkanesulfonate monooxygenase SsuD/methylene tetrahydromethanopterin reductase-like flavin-dependent oxidoreductase (luciferase family)
MGIDIEFNSGASLPMDAIPELARLAEHHGFGCAWGGEANNKDPTVMLAAIAAVTTKLQIGTAVYHILGRTPATLALQAAGLDELSHGRFVLGIGISNPTIAKWHGVSLDRPLSRLEEYLRIVQGALRGEKLHFEGKYYTAEGFKMAFKPPRKSVPIYIAAFGPKMSRLAGKLGDGVLINMASPQEIARIVGEVRSGAREEGKDPDSVEIVCKVRCSVAADHAPARAALSRIITFYALADYYRDLMTRMGYGAEIEAMRSAWRDYGFEAARMRVSDRLFNGLPIVAARSTGEVEEKLRPYFSAGASRVIVPYVPNSPDVVGEMTSFITAWKKNEES